jgi:hypothetical protein
VAIALISIPIPAEPPNDLGTQAHVVLASHSVHFVEAQIADVVQKKADQ